MIPTHQEKSRDYKKNLKSVAVIIFGSDIYRKATGIIKYMRLYIRKIFFLRNLQLRSTETFYGFSITKVHSLQKEQENLILIQKVKVSSLKHLHK
jgi:hypothetical protein